MEKQVLFCNVEMTAIWNYVIYSKKARKKGSEGHPLWE